MSYEHFHLPDWTEKVEHFVDRAIPYVLIVLTLLIVLEFTHYAEEYHTALAVIDYCILSFFIVDLFFKWNHTRKLVKFFKLYWIDLIAVFPFYLVFRAYFATRELFVAGEELQKYLHEAALLREAKIIKETEVLREAKFLREAELTTKIAKQSRFIRFFARGLRLLRARWYIVNGHFQNISEGYKKHH